MIRILGLVVAFSLLQGCSYLINLALYNNSDQPIEVCNLNIPNPQCTTIESKTLEKIGLWGDQTSHVWTYSISQQGYTGIYEFQKAMIPELASTVYCRGFLPKKCDIAIQYEQNSLLYWGGRDNTMPFSDIPTQPRGFPIKPTE